MNDSPSFDKMAEELAKLIRQANKSLEAYLLSLQKAVDNIIDQKKAPTQRQLSICWTAFLLYFMPASAISYIWSYWSIIKL